MTILWMNLAIVFIFSFFARYFATPNSMISLPIYRPNLLLSIGALLSLALVSGLRSNIGDTYFYKHAFEVNNFDWDQMSDQKNVGFWLFQKVLKNVSDDPQILILTASIITNVLIIIVFLKYSRFFELSTYVYITGGLYLVSMNGLRQVMTAAIIFTTTKFLINGNWFKYTIVVLIASTIHESALVLIPIYIIARYKAWSKATFILLGFSVLIVIGFDKFSAVLFSTIQDTQYGHYQSFEEGGASSLRVAVYGAPLFIAYLGREKLREIFPESDYIVNMALIGLVFMIISTQNWIFARFTIYFNLYQLILLSWVVKLFREKEQRFVYFGIIICYFLYYYFESVISLNILYKSNYLTL
ncbi:EpsG family protein [Neobacillus mesonae]|uniref:EpsG family protein n=1 Tax=Neobacillus mesonae TaxID=1193713 RepID=UPI00203B08C6|nr:EpsG family protein [Neobacillus mesonae]MCM3568214.1 EpsG family protein [Neobacillus mesonae]